MKTYRKLLLSTLIEKNACHNQVKLFKKLFGKEVNVSVGLCRRVADKFDFDWAAGNLLSAPALAEYDRVSASAWAEYARVTAPALAEYDRVTAPVFARAYINDTGAA